jgi:hypothetical protein
VNVKILSNESPSGPQEVDARVVPIEPAAHLSQAGRWRELLKTAHEEDAAWDWAKIIAEARFNPPRAGRYEDYALVYADEAQALMVIETARHLNRQGVPQVYIEYLSIAPWNRRSSRNPPGFSGCGSAMIRVAVMRSSDLGFSGRVGLHSLPGALGFYWKLGLHDFGPDPREENFHYLEFR